MTRIQVSTDIENGFENLEEHMIDIYQPAPIHSKDYRHINNCNWYLNCTDTVANAIKKIKQYRIGRQDIDIYKKFWLFKSNQLLAIITFD